MLCSLFLKECKQMLKCLTYYVVVICMVLFYLTQIGDFAMYEKPEPGQEDYGYTYSEDEAVIMQKTTNVLALEYKHNQYMTYPIGFLKNVTLNKKKQSEMGEIVSETTGLTKQELDIKYEQFINANQMTGYEFPVEIAPDLTYDRFVALMEKADQLLGSGSSYNEASRKTNARVPMTYEQALKEYEEVLKKDHFTGAYARLFCDYMGIILAILPVFIAVTRELRDRRARANEVIYSRKASSLQIILSRYLATLVMLLLPVILISIFPTMESLYFGHEKDIAMDPFAFLKYTLGWLLPNIMVATSVGIFLTQLTDSAIAILVQGFWWFASIFMGAINIRGGYGWNLVLRHNTLGNYQAFHDNFNMLVTNRVVYTIAAVLLMLLTVIVYDRKRKGRLDLRGKIFAHRKNQL